MKRQLMGNNYIYQGDIKLLEEGQLTGEIDKYNNLINNSVASEKSRSSIDWNQISDSSREASSNLRKEYNALSPDKQILFDRIVTGKYEMLEFGDYTESRLNANGIRIMYNKSPDGRALIDEAMEAVKTINLEKYDRYSITSEKKKVAGGVYGSITLGVYGVSLYGDATSFIIGDINYGIIGTSTLGDAGGTWAEQYQEIYWS